MHAPFHYLEVTKHRKGTLIDRWIIPVSQVIHQTPKIVIDLIASSGVVSGLLARRAIIVRCPGVGNSSVICQPFLRHGSA